MIGEAVRFVVALTSALALVAGLALVGADADLPPQGLVEHSGTQTVASTSSSFVIASFNLLGHGHTERGGKLAQMSAGGVRLKHTSVLLRSHGVEVVGLQEVHPPQYKTFTRKVPGYSFYPGPAVDQRNKQNIVAWKSSRFSLVAGRSVLIPYKRGRLVPMPVVQLRDKHSGKAFWVVTVHNAPGKSTKARVSRARALSKQITLTRQLAADGLPVFMTGDMNDRVGYFCRFTAGGLMRAAAGGSNAGSCQPPSARIARIDWIFGSTKHVSFSGYRFVKSPLVRRTSDHPLIVAQATMRS